MAAGPRKRRLCLRQVVNALRYICRTGCRWRGLPAGFPTWTAVHYYYRRWQQDGTLPRLNRALTQDDRIRHGGAPTPAVLCLDSRSVKLAPRISEARGLDAPKRVNGRKRQLPVDTGGRVWACRAPGRALARGQRRRPAAGRTPAVGAALAGDCDRPSLPRPLHRRAAGARAATRAGQPPAVYLGLRARGPALGRRADLRLAHLLPTPRRRLRAPARQPCYLDVVG
ncbi:hypothetical protein GCM10023186_23970 [Hymenobacter koreensis]|uniref:Insertion element IS402-like domain-containing protein n=1 Tax=Hymenobacter koreensis TaxID=1084523 RepID=A0ABP8J135_9BACT